jgi:3-phenylpropionate/trans-cinnamate dioxygenase ferredoxin subunit
MSEGGYERVAALTDVPEGSPLAVRLQSGAGVCVVRVGGEIYAFADRCSHADFPMSDGDMVDDYVIECGLHGAQFDVRTGEALEEPAESPLSLYGVKLRDGTIWIRVEE